ncbi:endonuclease/exonuclease/phosphatase family protein [Nocardioides caeni]|uniref:Endonuclease/exonuclease/phosphatase family protein n=1 Tax=Nocardioides caeni TaxID=574700 RepID=A0A4S8NQM8_9ACTN|nr:endonuclease/exonuclease/phosphatase family protein [Nocardioides caeni]THV17839.1 endonuclease/exonuclease/phosphatase family protein [Nocardioides caeni]
MRLRLRAGVCLTAAVVALPAVVLTVARLIGGAHRQIAIVQAFAPWAIPAYLLVVLLLGALLVRPATHRPGRRPVATAATLAGLGLVLHVTWFAPSWWGSAPDPDPSAEPLTVMTANLRFGEAEAQDVADAVADHDVDLLVLQEVTPHVLAALEDAGIDTDLPHRAGEADRGALGTLVFSRSPVTDVRRLDTVMGSWAMTTAGLRVLAVHPAYPLDDRWGAELAIVRDAVEDEQPDLVAGDFNASPDHAPMRAILDTGLSDAAPLVNAGWQPTWPTAGFRGWPIPASVAIDHVLVGATMTATDTTTVTLDGTDHRALVAIVVRRAD